MFVLLQVLRNSVHLMFPASHGPSAPACVAGITSFAALERWLSCYLPLGDSYLWWSPWLLLPASVLAFAAVPFACVYWVESKCPKHGEIVVPILTALSISLVILLGFDVPVPALPAIVFFLVWLRTLFVLGNVRNELRFRDCKGALKVADLRNWLSHKLARALVVFGFTLALAAIDTLGQTVYAVWQTPESSLGAWLATLSGGLIAAFGGARWFVGYFGGRAGGARIRLPHQYRFGDRRRRAVHRDADGCQRALARHRMGFSNPLTPSRRGSRWRPY